MSATALALVLVAALLHALWNIVAKKAGGNHHFALMGSAMAGLIWAPVGLWFAWREAAGWGWPHWAAMVASAVVHLVYFDVLLRGYRAADLTVVYPVARGTGPLISATLAVLLLGETLTPLGVAGVLGVTAGVFLIAGGPKLLRPPADEAQRARLKAGLAYGAATGVAIAGYTVIDGYAVKVLLISPIAADWIGHVLRVPMLLPRALHDRAGFVAAWRTQWRHALLMAVVSPVAYVMVLYAATMAPLSHVAPAREVSMLFAALLGGRLLGEGDRAARLAGAALIALGVAGLALG